MAIGKKVKEVMFDLPESVLNLEKDTRPKKKKRRHRHLKKKR